MTPSQHINDIANRLDPALKKKYAAGVKAHGGGLWKKNVGPEIEGELLNLIVYVYTREEQVQELVKTAYIILGNADQHFFDYATMTRLRAALTPFLTRPIK